MDNRLQATFMPRQAAVAGGGYVRPKGHHWFMTLGIVIFLLVGASYGGLYFYKDYVKKNNEEKQKKVQTAVSNFEPELTKELTLLKARIDVGENLIKNHRAFSRFLTLLEKNTVQTVQFTELAYDISEDNKVLLSMTGDSRSYNAIAYQSDVFSRVPQIKAPVFSGLSVNDKGVISFKVTAELDSSAISYAELFANGANPAFATTTSPTASSTPTATTTRSSTGTSPVRAGSRTTTTTPRPTGTTGTTGTAGSSVSGSTSSTGSTGSSSTTNGDDLGPPISPIPNQ